MALAVSAAPGTARLHPDAVALEGAEHAERGEAAGAARARAGGEVADPHLGLRVRRRRARPPRPGGRAGRARRPTVASARLPAGVVRRPSAGAGRGRGLAARPGGPPCRPGRCAPRPAASSSEAAGARRGGRCDRPLHQGRLAQQHPRAGLVVEQVERRLGAEDGRARGPSAPGRRSRPARLDGGHHPHGVRPERPRLVEPAGRLDRHRRRPPSRAPARPRPPPARRCARRRRCRPRRASEAGGGRRGAAAPPGAPTGRPVAVRDPPAAGLGVARRQLGARRRAPARTPARRRPSRCRTSRASGRRCPPRRSRWRPPGAAAAPG